MFQCLAQLVLFQEQLAQIAVRFRLIGVELDRLPKLLGRLGSLPPLSAKVRLAKVVVKQGRVRSESQRCLELLGRLDRLTLRQQRHTEIVVCFGIIGLEPQRHLAAGDGPIDLAAHAIGFGEIAIVGSGAGIEDQRPADPLDRLLAVALLKRDHAEKVQRVRMIGIAREELLVQLRRLF